MEAFTQHTGVIAALDRANVDTDQIIPKQFLKSIKRTGFGPSLFFDWRYRADGSDDPEFELNRPEFKGASILLVKNNFGCGSSREHAVWAVAQDGYRVIIAPRMESADGAIPGFADIFRNNCGKNGILTIELSAEEVGDIFAAVNAEPGVKAIVDLTEETLTLLNEKQPVFRFKTDSAVRERLLNGLDDISLTLQNEDSIAAFEKTHSAQL